jgi:hypothetical protein
LFFLTLFASATAPGINLTIQDVLGILTGLACWFARVALTLIVVAVIYYGIRFLMAQGDPAKLTEAKRSFLWGLVGVAVVIGTYTIIATIANALGITTAIIPLTCP